MARIYVSLTLSCPSRAFIWREGAEYPIVVWSISSTNFNDSCWPALFLQYKIRAKVILHFFQELWLEKPTLTQLALCKRVLTWDTSGTINVPRSNK